MNNWKYWYKFESFDESPALFFLNTVVFPSHDLGHVPVTVFINPVVVLVLHVFPYKS